VFVLALRAVCLWCVIVVAAIANGLFREGVLSPLLGPGLALPLSGLLLSMLILLVSFATVTFLKTRKAVALLRVGLLWVALTLAFEFTFGHFVAGKSLPELLQVFDPSSGDLFLVALCVTAIAPLAAAKARGLL
jgi:hypothetical protein